MTLRHWQMEKVSGSAEPLLSTTGNKGLYKSSGSTIVYDSTALFGKSSVRSKHFFDTDAAGSLSDNEFTIGFWFYVPTGTELRYIFQLGLHNTDVSANGHTCVGLFYSYYSNKIFFTTGYRTAAQGSVELGGLSQNVWHHCYISRTNSGTNSTLQVKITRTDGTVVHDESEVYTKADFSIDESGTGQYSYFNGHPAGGSLTLTNGRIEDFILKNGSVLSYASIYNSSAEVFQSDEPQVSVSTGAGSATLSDSNFTGTKTYSFYDTDAETLLQSGTSNSYTSYASSSVAYTALVSDTDNNRVISTFFISQGGNDMAAVLSGSTRALAAQVNVSMLGGIEVGAAGQFQSLAKKAAPTVAESNQYVSSSLLPDSGTTIIKALNVLNKKAGEAAPAGASGSVQFKLSDSSFGSNSAYSISGDVLSVAIVTASGDFHSDAAVTANKLKTVSDAAIGGAFAVTGLTNVAALTASGDLHSDAAVTAAKMKLSGEAAIGGALTVTGVTNVAALTASGDLHSDASVTAAKMKLSGEAEVGGALTVTGVTNVAALTASGDLHSDAAVTANKLETVGNATIGGVLLGEGIISGSAGINGSIIRSAGNIIINPGGIARGAAVAAAQAEGLSALILPGTDPQGKFRTYRLSVSGGMLQTYVYTGAMDPA